MDFKTTLLTHQLEQAQARIAELEARAAFFRTTPIDLEATWQRCLTWKPRLDGSVDICLWNCIQAICQLDSSRAKIVSDIHNNCDGTKTYFTVQVELYKHTLGYTSVTFHLNGTLRGSTFNVTSIDKIWFKQMTENVVVF